MGTEPNLWIFLAGTVIAIVAFILFLAFRKDAKDYDSNRKLARQKRINSWIALGVAVLTLLLLGYSVAG